MYVFLLYQYTSHWLHYNAAFLYNCWFFLKIIMELRCKDAPFWQEFSVKSLMLRWPLRPVGLLFNYLRIWEINVLFAVEMQLTVEKFSTMSYKHDLHNQLTNSALFTNYNNYLTHLWAKVFMPMQYRKFNVTSILWVYLQVPCDCHIVWPINTWNRSTSICTFYSSYFCPVMVKLKIVCLYVNVMFLNDKTNELFIGCLNLQCCE